MQIAMAGASQKEWEGSLCVRVCCVCTLQMHDLRRIVHPETMRRRLVYDSTCPDIGTRHTHTHTSTQVHKCVCQDDLHTMPGARMCVCVCVCVCVSSMYTGQDTEVSGSLASMSVGRDKRASPAPRPGAPWPALGKAMSAYEEMLLSAAAGEDLGPQGAPLPHTLSGVCVCVCVCVRACVVVVRRRV